MRLFCEHILGIGPIDEYLRHNGRQNGCCWPDGYAASAVGGGINMVAAFHGPIEEQARLSNHAQMVLQFVNRQSFLWLRTVLRMETESARQLLREWQEATLRAVEALQITSAAIVPLHFVDHPDEAPELQGTPCTGEMQAEDRFDGELEADVRNPELRRVLASVAPRFLDHHVKAHHEANPEADKVRESSLPLTGAHLSRLPHWRLQPELSATCGCSGCASRAARYQELVAQGSGGVEREAAEYVQAFAADFHGCTAVSSIHRHTDTCFKYVEEDSYRKPQHCRVGFVHFVRLCVKKAVASGRQTAHRVVQRVIARVGKEPVLPWNAGEARPSLDRGRPIKADRNLFRPGSLGASIESDDRQARRGRVNTVRFNPREGSTLLSGMPAHRGN